MLTLPQFLKVLIAESRTKQRSGVAYVVKLVWISASEQLLFRQQAAQAAPCGASLLLLFVVFSSILFCFQWR